MLSLLFQLSVLYIVGKLNHWFLNVIVYKSWMAPPRTLSGWINLIAWAGIGTHLKIR